MVIEPSAVHGGRYDCNEVGAAASAVLDAASAAEPGATVKVQAVATATGGTVERLGSRLKSRPSVLAKLERFRGDVPPHYRLARFNDGLRYTIMYPDLTYWRAAQVAVGEFRLNGWSIKAIARGWTSKGYKGLNLTVITPDGFHFEVQLHTTASLAAAERTHRVYAEQRDLPRGSRRWRELERVQQQVWSAVPTPPGRRELS